MAGLSKLICQVSSLVLAAQEGYARMVSEGLPRESRHLESVEREVKGMTSTHASCCSHHRGLEVPEYGVQLSNCSSTLQDLTCQSSLERPRSAS